MIVICVNNSSYPVSLEVNKEYEAKEIDGFYQILDETLEEYLYPKEFFKIKDF